MLSSPDIQKLCDIVTGVGSLHDLEASLDQSSVSITSAIVTQIIDSCKNEAPNRRLLRFFSWSQKNFKLGDTVFNHMITASAENNDLTAMDILISDLRKESRKMDIPTFCSIVETFVKQDKEDDTLGLFKNIEKFKCPRNSITLSIIVHALCSKGHARKAEGVVWHHKDKISVEPCIYWSLLHGWCFYGNVKEVRKIVEEMKSLGLYLSLSSYNTFLRCICKRNLKFNPSALVPEATNVMTEMRTSGVPPNAVSFNILLSCLGKARRVKEACCVFYSMREAGCAPDWISYYLVVKVLYLTGWLGRGNKIIDQMVEEGLFPEAKFYYGLIGILCGIEKVDHALQLFERMKKNCVGDHGPAYDLLIAKLCRGGAFEKGKQLWDEAVQRGACLQCSMDLLDPSKTEVFRPTRKMEKVSIDDWKKVAPKKRLKQTKLRKKKKRGSAT